MRAEVSETNNRNHKKCQTRGLYLKFFRCAAPILANALQTRSKIPNTVLGIPGKSGLVNINHLFLQEQKITTFS